MKIKAQKRMTGLLIRGLGAIVTIIFCLGTPLSAQVVAIKSSQQEGHGFMFRKGATCYVVLPKHVAANSHRVTVFSAAPVTSGQAHVETPFWPGLDLAVGVVRGAITARCTNPASVFSTLSAPEGAGNPQLVRLRSSGEVTRLPMRIVKTDYLSIEADLFQADDELFQGTSGAMLFSREEPIGMVIESLSPKRGRFVRVEEINLNLGRWLNRRGAVFSDATAPPSVEQPSGFAVTLIEATAPPISPDYSADNLLGDGAYIFQPTRTTQIVFRVDGDGAVPLTRVRIFTDPNAAYAMPRGVEIHLASAKTGRRRPFTSGEMASDGTFDRRRSAQNARWIIISVKSAWSDGPVRIDRVVFE